MEEMNLYTAICFHIIRYGYLFSVSSYDECSCLGKVVPFKSLSCSEYHRFD